MFGGSDEIETKALTERVARLAPIHLDTGFAMH